MTTVPFYKDTYSLNNTPGHSPDRIKQMQPWSPPELLGWQGANFGYTIVFPLLYTNVEDP